MIIFAGDYAAFRLRIPNQRPQFGTVHIRPYYAVKLKDGKTDLMFADPLDETCVYSLFPQPGYRPCWYAAKHQTRRIDVQ